MNILLALKEPSRDKVLPIREPVVGENRYNLMLNYTLELTFLKSGLHTIHVGVVSDNL